MTQWLSSLTRVRLAVLLATCACIVSLPAHASPCIVADASGTAALPPVGCDYTTPDVPAVNDMFITNGLPPATFIQIDAVLKNYVGIVAGPGGSLGGEAENYSATLEMPLVGHGSLSGYNRVVNISVLNQSHSAPRTPGSTPQSFATDMFAVQGQIVGDPDFDLLRVTAGTAFGMPSPGQTTLTRLGPPGSNWNVDSFFDIFYRIDFVGAPGGALGGMSGSSNGTARFVLGAPIPEPGTMTLAFLGALAFIRRHRSRQEAAVGVNRRWSGDLKRAAKR